ncbi:MAG: tol-pal system YbgF family protein [Saprospiraceae bacterium]
MKSEHLEIELIERFQNKKLTNEERKFFYQRLLEDEKFAKTVQLQLNITEEIDTFWTNNMITKIEEWEKIEQRQHSEKVISTVMSETISKEVSIKSKPVKIPQNIKNIKQGKKQSWFKYIIIVLILLSIIIGVCWYLFLPKEPVDLFAKNFESYEDVIENHSAEDSDLLTLAMGAYEEKYYSVAMITLKRFLNEVDEISPENKTAAEFYLAVSNLGTGNANTAKRQFETIQTDENNPFQQQADWYIALANIKTDNVTKAKIALSKIQTNPNHTYHKQATELLKSLE